MNLNIIKRTIITEKSINDAKNGKYTFEVLKEFNKRQIKNAVEKHFKVEVVNIFTRIMKGKRKRVGARRMEIQQSPWKKATVVLKKGQKIDLFEGGDKK